MIYIPRIYISKESYYPANEKERSKQETFKIFNIACIILYLRGISLYNLKKSKKNSLYIKI
jgi:hypothetical protein